MRENLPSGQETDVLEIFASQPRGAELYGLQMVKLAPEKLGRTSVYVVLTRMLVHGLLEARLETDEEQKVRGPKRRLYKITKYGRKLLEARQAVDRAARSKIRLASAFKPRGAL
jgi:DNA-binding PadR family transcriptional regulator